MKLYVRKMLSEREELKSRIDRAVSAIETDPFGMDKTQKILLAEQVKHMKSYLECLDERIEYEKNKSSQ